MTAPLPVTDDDGALARAAADDPAAFEAIYRRHRTVVYRYARSRTTSEDAAVELTAVTFERALRSIGSFQPRGGGLAAWLLRIARNAATDDARRTGRRPSWWPGGAHDVAGLATEPVDPQRTDEAVELRALVASLPPRQREVIQLRYAGGLSAREIGSVLSMSEGAAQKHLERALHALREAYRDA